MNAEPIIKGNKTTNVDTIFDTARDLHIHRDDYITGEVDVYMPYISVADAKEYPYGRSHMHPKVFSLWYAIDEDTSEAFYYVLNTLNVDASDFLDNPDGRFTQEGKDAIFHHMVGLFQNVPTRDAILKCFDMPEQGNIVSYYHGAVPAFVKNPRSHNVRTRLIKMWFPPVFDELIDSASKSRYMPEFGEEAWAGLTMNNTITLDYKFGNEERTADLFRLTIRDRMSEERTWFVWVGVDGGGKYYDEIELKKKFNSTDQINEIKAFLMTNNLAPLSLVDNVQKAMSWGLCKGKFEVEFEQVHVQGEIKISQEFYNNNK
jgi:hypothetical protein